MQVVQQLSSAASMDGGFLVGRMSMADEERTFKVAVVGGGLAGLSAAKLLSAHPGFGRENVVLLEASNGLGGRIQNVSGIAPWPVEIGAEFLHGRENSSMKRLVDEMECVQRELNFPDYYYIGPEGRLLSKAEALEHSDIEQVHHLFKAMIDEEMDSPDMSVAEYLCRKGVNPTVFSFAEAIYGNDFGCSLDDLGVHECIEEARQWIYGDMYLILDRPLSSVVNSISQNLDVRTNWVVKAIERNNEGKAYLHSQDGRLVIADHVIVTVPVTVLQQKLISFSPPLPQSKVLAAKAIRMSNVLKVVMAFSDRFWPQGLFDVVCSDCFLPEVWMTEYPRAVHSSSRQTEGGSLPLGQFTVIGFIAGERASKVAAMPEAEVLRQSLAQLDTMFGEKQTLQQSFSPEDLTTRLLDPADTRGTGAIVRRSDVISPGLLICPDSNPASSRFMGGMIVNWADREFIRGGYSHPSVNARGARSELSKPFGNIFFAGEATHPGVNPCLQAAIDTGTRAALEVVEVCRRRSGYEVARLGLRAWDRNNKRPT